MVRFIIRRLISMIGVMVLISVLTFLLIQKLPAGDPAVRLAGRLATQQQIQLIRHKYGFDKPIYVQYVKTMGQIFSGQAYSYSQGLNVDTEIRQRLPVTLSLGLGAGVIWLLVSILFGTLAAIKAGRYADRVLTILSMIGVSLPPFFLGTLLIYYLGFKANIFPLSGYVKFTDNPWQWFTHLAMPWFTLSVLFIGFYSRVLRSTILDNLNEDYVRTARAKGLSERQVLIRHVLRNSLIPIISLWGLDLAQVIGGGAIITETVYSLPGVGQLAAQSIGLLDLVTILAITILTAFAVVLLGAIVDIIYALLDPRIRLS